MEIGEVVLYAGNGVCEVAEITDMDFGSGKEKYYVLKPVFSKSNTFFIPAGNENMLAKIRRILTKEEIDKTIAALDKEENIWIDDEVSRKSEYKRILNSGNCLDIIRMIHALYLHREKLKNSGKRLHLFDEHTLKDAENILYDEFAYSLGIEKESVPEYISGHLN